VTQERSLPTAVVALLAALTGAALVLVTVVYRIDLAIVAALIALCALVPVRVPWGGSVSVAGVPLVAIVALVPHVEAAATAALAVLGTGLLLLLRHPRPDALHAIARLAGSALGAIGGVLLIDALVVGAVPVLAAALGASVGVVLGDLVVDRYAPGRTERVEIRSALPVHLTLACAGILVAVAVDAVGVAMAAVAAFPLLITRFSFARYAGATDTLDQTVQALGLVPELAGLAPLGHSERSAHYARALSRALGFNRAATTRVVTATRLHHIGGVPYDDSIDPADATPDELAGHGARILRQSGFSPDVADLLADAKADVLDADAPSIEAAVVRVAAVFDELVGDDLTAADRGLALVSGAARDPHSRRAAAALLDLAATRPTFVADAVAAGERFREAAVGLDLEAVTATRGGPGELLPFTRRI
jgi:hypothetical protein